MIIFSWILLSLCGGLVLLVAIGLFRGWQMKFDCYSDADLEEMEVRLRRKDFTDGDCD